MENWDCELSLCRFCECSSLMNSQAVCLIKVFMSSDSINPEYMKNRGWGDSVCTITHTWLESFSNNQCWCFRTSGLLVSCIHSTNIYWILTMLHTLFWELEKQKQLSKVFALSWSFYSNGKDQTINIIKVRVGSVTEAETGSREYRSWREGCGRFLKRDSSKSSAKERGMRKPHRSVLGGRIPSGVQQVQRPWGLGC